MKTIILFALLVIHSVLALHQLAKEDFHSTLKGADPVTGFTMQYGCYKSYCWSYCSMLGKMWCWTNKKSTDGKKSCTTDSQCNGYYYKCVSPCGF